MLKQCAKCKEIKDLELFRGKSKSWCKKCHTIASGISNAKKFLHIKKEFDYTKLNGYESAFEDGALDRVHQWVLDEVIPYLNKIKNNA